MTRYYVASWGSDLDPGTFEKPFQTLGQAFSVVIADDEIYVGQGGSALELPLHDLTVDCKIVGQGRGNDSTIRLRTGNVFRVLGGAVLGLDSVNFIDEAAASQPGVQLLGGSVLDLYRTSFYMVNNFAIHAVSGSAVMEQGTVVYQDPANKAPFPALVWDAGSFTTRNSIISGFSVGLQRALTVSLVSEATDWNCATPVAPGAAGDYDLFVDPEFVTLALSGVPADPDLNLTLSPTSKCIDAGEDLGYTDFSGSAPDLGAWETVFEVPLQFVGLYNIFFFLWVTSTSLDEVWTILQQTQDNCALSTCDAPTLRDKFGQIAGVFRPVGFDLEQFRTFLQVLFNTFELLPAREVFDEVVDALFGSLVPGGEEPYYETDYYWQRRWNLLDDPLDTTKVDIPDITVITPLPSLSIQFGEFFFHMWRRWWRAAPSPSPSGFVVLDNQTTYIYSDGTVDANNFVIWQTTTNVFDIPLGAYILVVVTAAGGTITDLQGQGLLGIDAFANDEQVVFNGYEVIVNAPGEHILPPGESELALLFKQVLPWIVSAHKLAYMKLDFPVDPNYWVVHQ